MCSNTVLQNIFCSTIAISNKDQADMLAKGFDKVHSDCMLTEEIWKCGEIIGKGVSEKCTAPESSFNKKNDKDHLEVTSFKFHLFWKIAPATGININLSCKQIALASNMCKPMITNRLIYFIEKLRFFF